jgi:hypothetical protein
MSNFVAVFINRITMDVNNFFKTLKYVFKDLVCTKYFASNMSLFYYSCPEPSSFPYTFYQIVGNLSFHSHIPFPPIITHNANVTY